MHKRLLIVGTALVMILFIMSSPGWAAPHYQARSTITNPSDGMTLGGAVDVTGIATHPNMRFYQLRYAAGPRPTGDSQWVDFAIVEAPNAIHILNAPSPAATASIVIGRAIVDRAIATFGL